jgi:peptidoglycan biosynthesis protein MviN/MurJ (putative lipid II flippase)
LAGTRQLWYPVLLLFVLTETLETQSYIISTMSRATGDEAFAVTSLAAGVIKIVLSIYLAGHLGLPGVALGTAIALMSTTHWYMPLRGLNRLKYSKWAYIKRVVLPCLLFFGLTVGLLKISSPWIQTLTSPVYVGTIVGIATLLLGLFLWFLVLNPADRSKIKSRIQMPAS